MKFLVLFIALFAFTADIPRAWEKGAVDTFELPLQVTWLRNSSLRSDWLLHCVEKLAYVHLWPKLTHGKDSWWIVTLAS
jgi:hypothetical protein